MCYLLRKIPAKFYQVKTKSKGRQLKLRVLFSLDPVLHPTFFNLTILDITIIVNKLLTVLSYNLMEFVPNKTLTVLFFYFDDGVCVKQHNFKINFVVSY